MCLLSHLNVFAQSRELNGWVRDEKGAGIEAASVYIQVLETGILSDSTGFFKLQNLKPGTWSVRISALSHETLVESVIILSEEQVTKTFTLEAKSEGLEEVVVSATLKEVSKLQSPVPVEVYTNKFFLANPNPTIFESLQNVNGVRPQINCNVCNTGDIHINGMEGPYTMVLIDGMPIVSGLSSVYGLSGIPQALIDRIEIVKGPASTLYGSEAVGGLINVITKSPLNTPIFSADMFTTSWGEYNAYIATKFSAGKDAESLFGINYFNYQIPFDKNDDGFTDLTLQNRISVFNKLKINRPNDKIFTLAGRYVYEDRWGGEMNWSRKYRGGEEVYGESIYTSRWETFGTYQLPTREKILFQFSANGHDQNSVYGKTIYLASQNIGFGQFTWFKTLNNHDLLTGLTFRHIYYDDNTPATSDSDNKTKPAISNLPGIFIQDQITLNKTNVVLLGMRYDYNSIHGSIFSPRINYKWNSKEENLILRFGIGNGYRIVNVFTEDHAALTGARKIVFANELKPETSWNANLNVVNKIYAGYTFIGIDATAFYTYFTNKIIPDYYSDPNKIIYDNLKGHAVSAGVSLNVDVAFANGVNINAGATLIDVYSSEGGNKIRQLFTERFSGTWKFSYKLKRLKTTIDYTGNVYGPMRLPLLSDLDPRSEFSPWWSIQNIQFTRQVGRSFEVYAGIKNLLNWTPSKGNPFLIARSHDPFDKQVEYDSNGQVLTTPENPYALTFDPTYVYAQNQGIRGFIGFRVKI